MKVITAVALGVMVGVLQTAHLRSDKATGRDAPPRSFGPHAATSHTAARVNPYVVGTPVVRRYLEVARECATARLTRFSSQP